MISGLKNLAYLARGTRTYGSRPIIARARKLWEFQFIFKGRAVPTGASSDLLQIHEPRLCIFHPNSINGWTDEPGGVSEIFVIHFHYVPEELSEQIGPTKSITSILSKSDCRRISDSLAELWDASISKCALFSLKLQQILMEMTLLAVARTVVAGSRSNPANKISRAMYWFEENIGEHPSVEKAARAIGVSPAHLRRLFADCGRPSPKSELIRIRMDAAKRCLLAGWKHETIAEFLGFSEVSSFARAFRDNCGMPPGAWLSLKSNTPNPD